MHTLDRAPIATTIILILVAVAAIAGAVAVGLGSISFQDYLDALAKFAGAVGLLAVGRGISTGLLARK